MSMLVIDTNYKMFKIHIKLDSQITIITGASGSGKTLLYQAIPSEINGISVHKFTYGGKMKYIIAEVQDSPGDLFLLDRTELLFKDPLRAQLEQVINDSHDSHFLLFGRYRGLLNIPTDGVKSLEFVDNTLRIAEKWSF